MTRPRARPCGRCRWECGPSGRAGRARPWPPGGRACVGFSSGCSGVMPGPSSWNTVGSRRGRASRRSGGRPAAGCEVELDAAGLLDVVAARSSMVRLVSPRKSILSRPIFSSGFIVVLGHRAVAARGAAGAARVRPAARRRRRRRPRGSRRGGRRPRRCGRASISRLSAAGRRRASSARALLERAFDGHADGTVGISLATRSTSSSG